MATINDLICQIENVELRDRIQKEVDALSKQKKFGLVFEDHIPECTLLYDVPVQRGRMVAIKGQDADAQYFVAGLKNGVARCISKATSEASDISVEKLVCVAQFGVKLRCLQLKSGYNICHVLFEFFVYNLVNDFFYLCCHLVHRGE